MWVKSSRLRPDEIENILKTISDQPDFLEVTVRSNLTQRELSKLAVLSPILEGVLSFRKGLGVFIRKAGWQHILQDMCRLQTKKDVNANPELRYLPASRIGRSGWSRHLNTISGVRQVLNELK